MDVDARLLFQIVHKKVYFFDRCGETGNSVDGNVTCGDINDVSAMVRSNHEIYL